MTASIVLFSKFFYVLFQLTDFNYSVAADSYYYIFFYSSFMSLFKLFGFSWKSGWMILCPNEGSLFAYSYLETWISQYLSVGLTKSSTDF